MDIQVIALGGSLRRPLRNANSVWTGRRGVLLRLGDGEHLGLGEACPLPNYSPDRVEDCNRFLSSLALGSAPQSLKDIEQVLSAIPQELPAARFAVETALLDLLSQQLDCSLSALLTDTSAESAARCGLLRPETALSSAGSLLARGVTSAKLKVGRSWSKELAIIEELRGAYPTLKLRLDVNGSWSVPEALANMDELSGLGIEFVEQPVAPTDMALLHASPCPIAADESLRSEAGCEALQPLIEASVLVAIVLKPTVLGGTIACMKLHRWASEQGVQSIASHCFDGPIATAAVAELAVATAESFAAGVDAHDGLSAWPAAAIPQFAHTEIHPHQPGLGTFL